MAADVIKSVSLVYSGGEGLVASLDISSGSVSSFVLIDRLAAAFVSECCEERRF